MQLTVILLLAVSASLCLGVDRKPGLKIMYTNESLTLWHQEYILGTLLKERLNNSVIPSIHEYLSTIFGSKFNFTLTDIQLKNYEHLKSNVTVSSKEGLLLKVDVPLVLLVGKHNTTLDNGFTDQYKWNGNFTLVIRKMSLTITKEVISIDKDTLKWESTNMTGSIESVEVYTNDHQLNSLMSTIDPRDIKKLFMKHFNYAYKNLTEYEMDLTVNITEDVTYDMSLVRPPLMHDGDVELLLRAEAMFKGEDSKYDQEPTELEPYHPNTTLLYSFTLLPFNSMGHLAHHKELLDCNFTKVDLPENSKKALDTSCDKDCFGKWFPKAGENFPQRSVELEIETVSPPYVTINHGLFELFMEFALNVTARKNEETPETLFKVHLRLNTIVHSSVLDTKIHLGLLRFNTTVDTTDSKIGDLPTENVLTLCNLIFEKMWTKILVKTKYEGIKLLLPELLRVTDYNWVLENNVATLLMDLGKMETN